MPDDERPSVRRLPASGTHVAVKVEQGSDHNFWSDLTLDVTSSGGIFVATFHPLPLGTLVYLLVTLEGEEEEPVSLSGVVRWTRPHREGSDGAAGVGIRFIDLDAESAGKLSRFVTNVREPMIFELEETPMRKRANR